MFTFFKEPKVNFQAVRRPFLCLSALFVVAGLYSIFLLSQGKVNFGTDFGGGVMLNLSAKNDIPFESLRKVFDEAGWKDAQIQKVTDNTAARHKVVVRLRRSLESGVGTIGVQVVETLQKTYPDAGFTLEGSEEVGPAVSSKLRDDAIKAFLISIIVILVYIAFRFDFHFGVVSVIATVHDVLFMLAFIVLTKMEFNLLSITAILTISGYSLNDTVVIFDRMRENLKLLGKMSYSDMVNLSLNETLNRTINTGGTVLLALLPVYLVGGEVLHDFSLTLLVGILVGSYSSIFVAAALMTEWQMNSAKHSKASGAKGA
jgi:preprotein translocase SecF subunit